MQFSKRAPATAAAVVCLASLVAAGCGREPGARAPGAADSTRTQRQRIAALEAARSFGGGELQRDLRHADPRLRRAAALALGRIQDPAALPDLLPLLGDPDSTVARQAAFALGQLQGLSEHERHALQSELVALVDNHPRPSNRYNVEALAKQGGPEIAGVLSQSLATGVLASAGSEARDPFLEGVAAAGLGRLGTAEARALLCQVGDLRNRAPEAAWRIAAAMAAAPDTAYLEPLLSLLDHPDPFARAAGARALGKLADPRVVQPLVGHIADLDWQVRASILHALAELSGKTKRGREALDFCASLTGDTHPLVREAAVAALDSFRVGPHAALLERRLGDSAPAVRLAALLALARARRGRALAAWEAARADSVAFVRSEALQACRWVQGDARALATLLQALESESPAERTAAAAALADPGLARGTRRARVRGALEAALHDRDFAVAATAAEGLGTLAMLESVPALEAACAARLQSRSDAEVRLAVLQAAAAMARSTTRRGATPLAALAAKGSQDADPRVVHAAAVLAARLAHEPDPPAAPPRAREVAGVTDSLPPIDLGAVQLRLVTAAGEAILELDGDRFPRTVANFLALVDAGFYGSGTFHRVVPAFVVQGGCPRGDGWGDAGWFVPCEYGDLRYDAAGIVGMAHAGRDTGGSQFFITHVPVPRLDGRYTAFGRVVRGANVIGGIVRGDRFRIERLPAPPP